MKPRWKDAPEWAEWLGWCAAGCYHWYEHKPQLIDGYWKPISNKAEHAGSQINDSCATLERRPLGHYKKWQPEIENDIIFNGVSLKKLQSDGRRLIEALRPLAHGANVDHPSQLAILDISDARRARDLLRELGEYPETCKECGQEIRK